MENNADQYMELAGIALRARDTYKFENADLRQKVGQLEVLLQKKELDLERLTDENAKLMDELEDTKRFNQMLQRMLKKMK